VLSIAQHEKSNGLFFNNYHILLRLRKNGKSKQMHGMKEREPRGHACPLILIKATARGLVESSVYISGSLVILQTEANKDGSKHKRFDEEK
jgi:hypothetical protein